MVLTSKNVSRTACVLTKKKKNKHIKNIDDQWAERCGGGGSQLGAGENNVRARTGPFHHEPREKKPRVRECDVCVDLVCVHHPVAYKGIDIACKRHTLTLGI